MSARIAVNAKQTSATNRNTKSLVSSTQCPWNFDKKVCALITLENIPFPLQPYVRLVIFLYDFDDMPARNLLAVGAIVN